MPTDYQRLSADEQKIGKLVAARLIVSVADVASAIIETERCTKLVGVQGLTLQVCEAYHEGMRTGQEEAERMLKENMLHCAAVVAVLEVSSAARDAILECQVDTALRVGSNLAEAKRNLAPNGGQRIDSASHRQKPMTSEPVTTSRMSICCWRVRLASAQATSGSTKCLFRIRSLLLVVSRNSTKPTATRPMTAIQPVSRNAFLHLTDNAVKTDTLLLTPMH